MRMGKKRDVAERRRLTPEDWADAALEAIARGGIAAVAVEPIARALGATKGSFYWHFEDRDDLVRAALARWEERQTEGPIKELVAIADPHERFAALRALEVDPDRGFDLRIEAALIVSAADPLVGPVLDRVLTQRLEFLVPMFAGMGFSRREARDRALLAFSSFLGRALLRRAAPALLPPGAGFRTHVERMSRLLVEGEDR